MKDDAFYYKAMYNLDEPLAHITPQNWEYPELQPTPFGTIGSAACSSGTGTSALMQQWKFDVQAATQPGGNGSQIESLLKPGQCLVFATNGTASYPVKTVNCSATDPHQRFFFNGKTSHVEYRASGQPPKCLDVNGDGSGTIGFWACKENVAPPDQDNQAFAYANNTFTQKDTPTPTPMCITYIDGSLVQVWVYTNGDEVDLLLNGKVFDTQTVAPFEKGTFALTYAPGNLTAVVRKNGSAWASDSVFTPGPASSIRLTVEPLMADAIESGLRADGQDAVLLTARVEDANGNVQHHSSNAEQPVVTFSVVGEGQLIGVGSGNPSDDLNGKAPYHRTFNGLLRAIVQTTKTAGAINVTASAPGLQSGSIELTTKAVPLLDA